MKKFKLALLATLFGSSLLFGDVWVNGYTKSNGTIVEGHYRTSPNSTTSDNYSTYGNYNPYTGKTGTVKYNTYY